MAGLDPAISLGSRRLRAGGTRSASPMLRFRLGSRLHHEFVNVAPAPVLMRLEASHDRMCRLMEMPRGVLARRFVAATDMSADEAKPQMHPPTARLEAFFAALRRAWFDGPDLIKVRTSRCHRRSPSLYFDTLISRVGYPLRRTPCAPRRADFRSPRVPAPG
jgi:hypothetical protein